MSSTKTVKVTNGKIVNYTITAPGYKTINGSQLITADTAINKNMIAETDPNGVYSLGDRIGGIASFVCYFNSTNPETNVDTKYAVFVLDAQYRNASKLGCPNTYQNLMPQYTFSDMATALTRKESATWNTNTIINGVSAYSETCPAFTLCRQVSVTLGGQTYQGQLPNMYELYQIWQNKATLDTLDPTLASYSSKSLTSWNMGSGYAICLQSQFEVRSDLGSSYILALNSSGTAEYAEIAGSLRGVIPVFEIPVE